MAAFTLLDHINHCWSTDSAQAVQVFADIANITIVPYRNLYSVIYLQVQQIKQGKSNNIDTVHVKQSTAPDFHGTVLCFHGKQLLRLSKHCLGLLQGVTSSAHALTMSDDCWGF